MTILKKILPPLFFTIFLTTMVGCLPALISSSPEGSGPQTAPSVTPGGTGQASMLQAAETAYNQGQYRAATDYYKQYLTVVPNPPNLEVTLASFGLAAEKAGQFTDAISAYERLASQFPTSPYTAEAQPRLVEVYLAAGDPQKANALAAQLLPTITDLNRRAGVELARAQSLYELTNYIEAFDMFMGVWNSAGGQTKTAAAEGVQATLTRLSQADLERIQANYAQSFPAPEATYLLIRLAAQAGDKARTQTQSAIFTKFFSTNPLMTQVTAILAALDSNSPLPPVAFGENYQPGQMVAESMIDHTTPTTMGDLGRLNEGLSGDLQVAAVLPLTGDSAAQYAQEVLAGLKLALNNFAGGALGLTVMDTRASAEEAARQVQAAADNDKILAVVGPFLSRESTLAAQTANKAGLPLIAISQRADLTKIGPYVFRLFLTPKHQAEAVARYAVRVQGHQALGVLYPENNYGRPIRGYYENEVRSLGSQVTVAQGYDTTMENWSADLAQQLTGGRADRRVASSYQAETGFTALYLPDAVAAVSMILPQLAYHDVTKMQFLGSPLWLNQEMLDSSARYVQGAVIPAPISELSQRDESKRFIESYTQAYGKAPDQFAAYGYDAGLALIKALAGGANSRQALQRALSQGTPTPGATGPFSFDNTGDYSVEPTLLTVKDRSFELLREAAPGSD